MRFVLPIVTSAILILNAVPVFALDCTKAKTDTEKAICASPALTAADDEMVETYSDLVEQLSDETKAQLKISQRNFIQNRDQCGSGEGALNCILERTIARTNFLEGGVAVGALQGEMPKLDPLLVQQFGDGKKGLFSIDYALTLFANPQTEGEKAFNAEMKDRVKDAPFGVMKDMIEFSVEYPWASSLSSRITLLTPDIISAEIENYEYEGGAHGTSGVSSVSLNRKTGVKIDIGAAIGQAGLDALFPLCREQIIARKQEMQSGFDPENPYKAEEDTNYSDNSVKDGLKAASLWRLETGQVTVTYNSYAVGAYAEGRFECKLPSGLLNAMSGGELELP